MLSSPPARGPNLLGLRLCVSALWRPREFSKSHLLATIYEGHRSYIAGRLEVIASRLEAIALGLEAIASRSEAITISSAMYSL